MSTAPELAAAAEAILALWQKQGLDSSSSLAMAEAAIGGYRAYLAALREAPVAWRVKVNDNGKLMYVYTEALPYDPLTDTGIKVRSEPEPLYISPSAGAPVAVKALEWTETTKAPGCPQQHDAATPFGVCRVFQYGYEDNWCMAPPGTSHGQPVASTLEAAKAAAQADYETRIRSALTASPADGCA